jgi:hypothetical protein
LPDRRARCLRDFIKYFQSFAGESSVFNGIDDDVKYQSDFNCLNANSIVIFRNNGIIRRNNGIYPPEQWNLSRGNSPGSNAETTASSSVVGRLIGA